MSTGHNGTGFCYRLYAKQKGRDRCRDGNAGVPTALSPHSAGLIRSIAVLRDVCSVPFAVLAWFDTLVLLYCMLKSRRYTAQSSNVLELRRERERLTLAFFRMLSLRRLRLAILTAAPRQCGLRSRAGLASRLPLGPPKMRAIHGQRDAE